MGLLTDSEWRQLAESLVSRNACEQAIRQTEENLRQGLVEEVEVRNKTRHRMGIQVVASKYYDFLHTQTYRARPKVEKRIYRPEALSRTFDWS